VFEQLDAATQQSLIRLSNGNNLAPIDDAISLEDFQKGFQMWDEQTTTLPSGRHLGHYKAQLFTDGQDTEYN
jgi:hypothetical protein